MIGHRGASGYRPEHTASAYELAAVVTFTDATGRRASYSVALRFTFAEDVIVVQTADAAPIAPESPAVHIAFVAASALSRVNRGAGNAPALLRSIAGVAQRTGVGASQEYYTFAIVLDRLAPDARVGLRTSAEPRTINGYPGMPTVLDLDGWRILVERATFALDAPPAFYFKTIYQAAPQSASVLLRAVSTYIGGGAPPANAAAVRVRATPSPAFPNRARQ